MSVYRRRVMQVKHPPNQITAVYNVTSTTSATALCYSNSKKYLQSVIVDGENIGVVNTYTFATLGEHRVQFVISKSVSFSGKQFFYNISQLVSVDFSDLRVGLYSAQQLFSGCKNLNQVKGIRLNGVNNASSMFNGCTSLTNLDASGWDLSNVTTLHSAFSGCTSLTNLDASGWDLSNATTFSNVFYNCSSLINLDVSNWVVRKINNCESAFSGCSSLTCLNMSNWILGESVTISSMFRNCVSLSSVDLPNRRVSFAEISSAFSGCGALRELDLSNCDFSSITNWRSVLSGCVALVSLFMDSEINESADMPPLSDYYAIFKNVTTTGTLYYYPHASFVEKFLPIIPSTWSAIDITTLE